MTSASGPLSSPPASSLAAPLFIVGCGHSGTSLLLSILGSHSALHAIPQETNVGFLTKAPSVLEQFDQFTRESGKQRWIEKSPRHIHRIARLLQLRPEARIILLLRDGRDVACSIQDRFGSLEMGITRWHKDNLAGEPFWEHPQVLVIRYESLVADFARTLSSILDFAGLPPEQGVFEYHREEKFYYADQIEKPPDGKGDNHDLYRNWQINQPVYDARGKWRRMTPDEKAQFKAHTGDQLIRYGYTENDQW